MQSEELDPLLLVQHQRHATGKILLYSRVTPDS
jgi:hypothetical protein